MRPHAPPRVWESLTYTITLTEGSGWAAFTYNARSDLPRSPSRTHTVGRNVDHTRHATTAQGRAGHDTPGHKAALPTTADGGATQGTLTTRVHNAYRATTRCTHTAARPYEKRPMRPATLHASSKSCHERGRARQTKPMMPSTLRQQSATHAPDKRSAYGWIVCVGTPPLCARSAHQAAVKNDGRVES